MRRFNPHAYGNPRRKTTVAAPAPSEASVSQILTEQEAQLDQSVQDDNVIVKSNDNNIQAGKENTPLLSNVAQKKKNDDSQLCGRLKDFQCAPISTAAARSTTRRASEVQEHPISKKPKPEVKESNTTNKTIGKEVQSLLHEPVTSPAEQGKQETQYVIREHQPRNVQNCLSHELAPRTNNASIQSPFISTQMEQSHHDTTAENRSNAERVANKRSIDLHEGQTLSKVERYNKACEMQLKSISLRNKGKDKSATTSLSDLAIARKASSVNLRSSLNGSPAPATSTQPKVYLDENTRSIGRAALKANGEGTPNTPRADLRSVGVATGSNMHLTPTSINKDKDSSSSMLPLQFGAPLAREVSTSPHPLLGWDNNMQPPPVDWHDRPRFDHNSSIFQDNFERWRFDLGEKMRTMTDELFATIPSNKLQNLDLTPDGVSMVPKTTTVGKHNAVRYGYDGVDAEEVLKYAHSVTSTDYKDWGKLDMSKPENCTYKTETTNDLVTNWIEQKKLYRSLIDAQIHSQEGSAQLLFEHETILPNPNTPSLNIYLRPACKADVSQMTEIYNWYIKNSCRTAEINPITEDEMEDRLGDVQSGKLPFLVAIERNSQATISVDFNADVEVRRKDPHPIINVDPLRKPMIGKEKIVGWASAEDFTASDYAERLSVELAIFVDPAYRQLGIGRCLLDKLLESCDRGYLKRGGYQFCCSQETRHLYSDGGGRDLHKLLIILRKWKYPKKSSILVTPLKYPKANPTRKPDDEEDDYTLWMKAWLESWNFEVEGVLKGIGAKDGRFIDQVFLTRETRWQPAEGKIPDPLPGL